jgi:hypothetical protein
MERSEPHQIRRRWHRVVRARAAGRRGQPRARAQPPPAQHSPRPTRPGANWSVKNVVRAGRELEPCVLRIIGPAMRVERLGRVFEPRPPRPQRNVCRQHAAPLCIMKARAAAGVVTASDAPGFAARSRSSSSPARMPAVELTSCTWSARPSQYGLLRWNGARTTAREIGLATVACRGRSEMQMPAQRGGIFSRGHGTIERLEVAPG